VSNTITMTVNPNFTPTVVLAVNPAGPVCAGTPVTFTATAAGTGSGSVTYTFYVNGSQVQSSNTNAFTSLILANGDAISCMISVAGGTCLTTNTAFSSTIPMVVNPNLTPAVALAVNPVPLSLLRLPLPIQEQLPLPIHLISMETRNRSVHQMYSPRLH
jgi:hypothetical protein